MFYMKVYIRENEEIEMRVGKKQNSYFNGFADGIIDFEHDF